MQRCLGTVMQNLQGSLKAGVWSRKGHVQSVLQDCNSMSLKCLFLKKKKCMHTHRVWNVTLLCQGEPKCVVPVTANKDEPGLFGPVKNDGPVI